MNITLRHLRAMHAIWEQGTFARAASVLGVVPSALTETIHQLEHETGAPLFDRRTRPPVPTPLGLEFLRETSPLIQGLDQALARLREHAGLHRGHLAVGATPSSISDRVGPALALFRRQHPGITCHLHDDVAETLARMVSDGRLDLAIAGRARHSPDLRQTEIGRDPFGLACAADHPLATRASILLQEIDPQALIALSADTGTQQLLMSCARIPDTFRQAQLVAYSTIAQLCMIRAGLGVALMPRNATLLFNDTTIRYVPVADLDLWRVLYLLEPALRASSHAATAFKALI